MLQSPINVTAPARSNSLTNSPLTTPVQPSPNKNGETLIEVPSDEIGRIDTNIDNLPYYHGLLGKEESIELLFDHGDFLVRQTEIGKHVHFVISIKWRQNIFHVLVKQTKTKKLYWTSKFAFRSVCELIAYHKRNRIPFYKDMLFICGLAKQKWQLNNEQIQKIQKLGEGQFGEVFKASLTISIFRPPQLVAVKTLYSGQLTLDQKKTFLKEASTMLNLKHPNVIKLYGVCAMKVPIMIVMEFCEGGSLEERLNSGLDDTDKQLFLYHAVCGLDYIHKNAIIHRDIAARNCLISKYNELKICDFGLSVKGDIIQERRRGFLPMRYMAPESLGKKKEYSTASDVYSYGALIYEVYENGKYPYDDVKLSGIELIKAIRGKKICLKLKEPTPQYIQKIFDGCREFSAENRYTTKKIIEIFKAESSIPYEEESVQKKLFTFCNNVCDRLFPDI